MDTKISDTLWVFALFSKCTHFSLSSISCSLLILAILWLAIAIIYWAHPGGPAWGKYRLSHAFLWTKRPIPGPRGWPIVGSMGVMTGLAHRKLASTAKRCGGRRLMAFSIGDTCAVVTCHPAVAREILHGSDFADRPVKESARGLMFDRAMGFAPHGAYWKALRRAASAHVFSPKHVRTGEARRAEIAAEMAVVLRLRTGPFRVREVLKRAALSNMMGLVFGQRYCLVRHHGEDYYGMMELKEMVDEGYELLGTFNWADHLTWLYQFDPQRIRVRCSKLVPKVTRFVTRIIEQHRADPAQTQPDFVDVLLSLQGPEKLSDSDMIAVLWETIFRGADTVAVLIEWILARLVLHPDVQSRVHDELDRVVGKSRAVAESDLTSLVYLTVVIKEVLRVNPPGPLLSWARLATRDTTVDGHHVPAGTTAMVDMWAIARDSEFWPNPDQFNPDRFLASEAKMEFSILGSDLRLAPFGSGRRACPGKDLGLTTVNFWVATLLHEFKWVTSDVAAVDLSEVLKLSCEMAHPLTAEVQPRRCLVT